MKRKYYIDIHPDSNHNKEHSFLLTTDKPESYFFKFRIHKADNYTKAKKVGTDSVYLAHNLTHFLKTPEQIKDTYHDIDIELKPENPILMYPFEDMKEVDLKQAWNFDYFEVQGLITIYKYLRRNFSYKMYLYYHKDKEMFMLSEKKYYFNIETEDKIKDNMIDGRFKLKLEDGKYMAVVDADEETKASKLVARVYNERESEKFTFHFYFFDYMYLPRTMHPLIYLSSNIFMFIPDTDKFERVMEFQKIASCFLDCILDDDNRSKQLSSQYYYFSGSYQFKLNYDAIKIIYNSGISDVLREFFIKKWILTEDIAEGNLTVGQQNDFRKLKQMRIMYLALASLRPDGCHEFKEIDKMFALKELDVTGAEIQNVSYALPLYQKAIEKVYHFDVIPNIVQHTYLGKSIEPYLSAVIVGKDEYWRTLIFGLMVNDYRHTKVRASGDTVNVEVCRIVFNALNQKEGYFEPIDLERVRKESLTFYTEHVNNRIANLPPIERKPDYYRNGAICPSAYNESFPGAPQSIDRKMAENKFLKNDESKPGFALGDLLVDACLCRSRIPEIIKKVKQKYPITNLYAAFNCCWADASQDETDNDLYFKEVIVLLVRCILVEQNNEDFQSILKKSKPLVIDKAADFIDFCDKAVKEMVSRLDPDSVHSLKFSYEVLTLISFAIQNQIMIDEILEILTKHSFTKYMVQFLRSISDVKIDVKPYAADFRVKHPRWYPVIPFWQVFYMLTDNRLNGQDIFMESYRKDCMMRILRFINLIYSPQSNGIFFHRFSSYETKKEIDNVFSSQKFSDEQFENLLETMKKLVVKYADMPYEIEIAETLFTVMFNCNKTNEHSTKPHLIPIFYSGLRAMIINPLVQKAFAEIADPS